MKKLLLILCATLPLVSCRSLVLEDRAGCPSYLFFDVKEENDPNIVTQVHVTAFRQDDSSFMAQDTTTLRAMKDRTFYLPIHKTEGVEGYGVLGFKDLHQSGLMQWTVQEGQDGVPLYRFHYNASALEEEVLIPVTLEKDHSRVEVHFLNFDGFADSGGTFPFKISIRGNTCGIDALSGVPVRGAFRYSPPEEHAGVFSFVAPRQGDHSLTMEVYRENDGELLDEFRLWDFFREKVKFSWEQPILPDFKLFIDYSESAFHISVQEWEPEDTLKFEI